MILETGEAVTLDPQQRSQRPRLLMVSFQYTLERPSGVSLKACSLESWKSWCVSWNLEAGGHQLSCQPEAFVLFRSLADWMRPTALGWGGAMGSLYHTYSLLNVIQNQPQRQAQKD